MFYSFSINKMLIYYIKNDLSDNKSEIGFISEILKHIFSNVVEFPENSIYQQ